jgi:Transglycosylase SLT domain
MKKLSRVRGLIGLVALVLALGACTTEQMIWTAFSEEGASQQQQVQAVEVARCESGLNPGAVSPGGGNVGLFQINRVHTSWVNQLGYSWYQMYQPYQNAQIAAELWSQQGWGPWSCARHLGY